MFKKYEKFNLTEDEYWECRQNMHTPSYHLYEKLEEEHEECSVLYFDSDDGVALISAYSEVFDDEGFKIELIDCRYCDINFYHMQEIIDIFITLAEEFNMKMLEELEEEEKQYA